MNDTNARLRVMRIVQAHAARRPVRAALAGFLIVYGALALQLAEKLLAVPPGALLAARIELADMAARGQIADQVDAETSWFTGQRPDGPGGPHPSRGQ